MNGRELKKLIEIFGDDLAKLSIKNQSQIFEKTSEELEVIFNINLEENFMKKYKDKILKIIFEKGITNKQDIILVLEANSNEIAKNLTYVAKNRDSLESKYHESDMKLISEVKNDVIVKYLYEVAIDRESLESKYHEADMKLISEAKSDVIAKYLTNVAKSSESLKSKYHEADMKLILEAKYDEIVRLLYSLAICKESLKDSENHKVRMKYVYSLSPSEGEKFDIDEFFDLNQNEGISYFSTLNKMSSIPFDEEEEIDPEDIYRIYQKKK